MPSHLRLPLSSHLTAHFPSHRRVFTLLALLCAATGSIAQTLNPASAYAQECAACHVAYPPSMLPAASWQRIVSGLSNHFGTDASLDAATTQQLGTWLAEHAGTTSRVRQAPPQDRITRSAWFIRQHDEVGASVWKRASVGSASNCAACHTGAAKGHFNEDDVRIPK